MAKGFLSRVFVWGRFPDARKMYAEISLTLSY